MCLEGPRHRHRCSRPATIMDIRSDDSLRSVGHNIAEGAADVEALLSAINKGRTADLSSRLSLQTYELRAIPCAPFMTTSPPPFRSWVST